MRAVRLHAPGGPEGLVNEELDTPGPSAGEALVRVHAAALTRDELEWPVDRLPAIPPSGRLVSIAEEPPADTEIASDYFVVEPNREQLVALAELVDGGEIRPAIGAVFPLADRAAFERSMERGKRGKVVLRVAEERP
jgi:NADPH:quinone reductase-like Zn-dependent oxidoreductase